MEESVIRRLIAVIRYTRLYKMYQQANGARFVLPCTFGRMSLDRHEQMQMA